MPRKKGDTNLEVKDAAYHRRKLAELEAADGVQGGDQTPVPLDIKKPLPGFEQPNDTDIYSCGNCGAVVTPGCDVCACGERLDWSQING